MSKYTTRLWCHITRFLKILFYELMQEDSRIVLHLDLTTLASSSFFAVLLFEQVRTSAFQKKVLTSCLDIFIFNYLLLLLYCIIMYSHADLKVTMKSRRTLNFHILQPPPPKCQDSRHEPPYLASQFVPNIQKPLLMVPLESELEEFCF